MNRHEADDSVNDALDRVAAAFCRDDIGYARAIIDDARTSWIADGAAQERMDRAKKIQLDLEFYDSCDAWFETCDGFLVRDKITSGNGYPPPVWKRACRKPHISFLASDAAPNFTPIPVRTYEHDGYAQDGLPIYREVAQ